MAVFDQVEGSKHTDSATSRAFLEVEDGSELAVLEQARLHASLIAHPLMAKTVGAPYLLADHFETFALPLYKRGEHQVFQATTVGGNVDNWKAKANVGFGLTGMMRYKSR